MRRMNAAAELEGKDFASIAASFLAQRSAAATAPDAKAAPAGDFWHKLFGPDFARLTLEHLGLVFLSLAASVVIGIPLGILAAKRPAAEGVIIGATGIVQTIPSLALLAVLIPLTGRMHSVDTGTKQHIVAPRDLFPSYMRLRRSPNRFSRS